MKQVMLKQGKAKPFFNGEPLIFSGALQTVLSEINPAELVQVYSSDKKMLGIGIFNPHSNYRVRLLTFNGESLGVDLKEIVLYRLKGAIERRKKFKLPNIETTIYRLVNSEADKLSGLIVDVAADTAIVSVTAYWVMAHRKVIQDCLTQLGFKHCVWRQQESALNQDGWREKSSEPETENIITVKENGALFQVDVGQGQKTGFYCDQRNNRLVVLEAARDKTVLDCFCYTGGFALNAAIGGATKVVGIDSSVPAIHLANANAALNKVENVEFIVAKVEDYLSELAPKDESQENSAESSFDFIILDPPKLAPTEKSLPRAKQKYVKLNTLAMRALPENGLLLTCSCSNALSEDAFIAVLVLAAKKAGRQLSIIKKMHAGPDHPFLPKSKYGNYLKAILVSIK